MMPQTGPQWQAKIVLAPDDHTAFNRQCGGCTLCCKLLPVRSLGKPANTRCVHQRHHGCQVYAKLKTVSPECHVWSCRWLVDEATKDMRRPDKVHYVIDLTPDFIGVRPDGETETTTMPVVVVWADPEHPDAWREDAALRAWMLAQAQQDGRPTLVRQGNDNGTLVAPPPLTSDHEWREYSAPPIPDEQRTWVNPREQAEAISYALGTAYYRR